MLLAYLLLLGRLFYIQVIRAPFYKEKAQQLTERKIPLRAKRGTIYDREGKKLAVTIDACNIYVQPVKIKDKTGTADSLAGILNCDRAKLLETLNSGDKFKYIARRVDIQIGEKVKKAKLIGVGSLGTTKRIYPGGTLAAHIIGFTDVDGNGIEGIEKAYNDLLGGRDGFVEAEVDARGKVIPGTKKRRVEPINGKDITLTIDSTLQHSLEDELSKSYKAYSAAGASAVMLDPKTGEVLALANMPTFNPNEASKSDMASRRDRSVTDLYEPGSTLKTITACAGLQNKSITMRDVFCCHGSTRIGKRTVRCVVHGKRSLGGHGFCNVAKILKYSCNIGAAGIGLRMGSESLYKFEDAFGFYEKPGSGLPGEVKGWHDSWEDWSDIRLANIAFGQGIVVSPMQMARAYAAVANGGLLMQPYIIKEIHNNDGTIAKTFSPHVTRRVMSAEVSSSVSQMLQGVVDEGTGKPASVDGYKVCGKTGSAQKALTTGRGYAAGKFVASFAGFLPLTDPRVVILVAVDEPKGSHWGATVAAPVFQGAARTAMWHMRVPPDDLSKQVSPVANLGVKTKHKDTVETPSSGRLRLGG